MENFDVVVLGGGAGGLIAAKEARRRGASVAIVQDGPVGGDCTFTGCIPSKTLLAEAARGSSFERAIERVHTVVTEVAATEDAAALAREGVEVIAGRGQVRTPRVVDVEGTAIRSKNLIVATGSRPLLPPIPGLAECGALTNESVFSLAELPASLVVLGGGPIGCELSQAFARLGSKVTLIEAADRLLPREDPAAGAVIARCLAADGVDVHTGSPVNRVERLDDGRARVHAGHGEPHVAAEVLAAFGRAPAGRGCGLEEIGVTVDGRGAVVVDDTMATGIERVWAVGDVTGRLQFTHVAGQMGWIAATNALSRAAKLRRLRFSDRAVPWATFTSPEVAHVGLTISAAAERHPDARVAHLPLDRVDRAITSGATDGFVTLIAAPRRGTRHLAGGRLVGATIVAPTAGELIHEPALAIQTNMFVGRLAQTSHAYPTWSMAVQQAALQFFGTSAGLRAGPIQDLVDP